MGIADYLEQKRKAQIRKARIEDAKRVSLGLFLGTAIGGAAGLLFAPKSGAETREDIANAAKDAVDNVKSASNQAIGAVRDKANEAVDKAKSLYSEHVEGKLTNIRPALDEVEDTVDEVKEDIKEGAENVADELSDK